MESSRVNSTGGERDGNMTEENLSPAEMYRRGESRLQLSQFQPDTHRALDKQLFRFPTGLDVETLDSSFAMLSLRQQNPLLDNRWTNRSSLQQNHQGINDGGDVRGGGWSLPPQREVDLQQMMNHYFQRTSSTLNYYVNGGSYGHSSVSQDVPDLSRGRDYGFGSWRSNEGFVNPSSLSLENERMGPIALLGKDPKSTLVLQEKIDEGSKETIDVIFNDVISSIYELMEHPFASQVLQKLMHKCSSQQISHIIDVITLNQLGFVKMCIDPVGTRSIQSLLSCLHSEEQILRVVGAVSVGILAFTRSNGAKHVIMQCFNEFPPSLNRDLIEVLVQNCFVVIRACDERPRSNRYGGSRFGARPYGRYGKEEVTRREKAKEKVGVGSGSMAIVPFKHNLSHKPLLITEEKAFRAGIHRSGGEQDDKSQLRWREKEGRSLVWSLIPWM
ncbi:hypothetical protein F2Q70_00025691 [Brassica cretica]|uniref:PUM-HD domain-containing protein n=1 Tax=Brassica cretica TaxID=69181 RepID=A0A8S9L6R2_BRACR|nr:hypothetical protein F2Q70_00025691 [Brassica cretica]